MLPGYRKGRRDQKGAWGVLFCVGFRPELGFNFFPGCEAALYLFVFFECEEYFKDFAFFVFHKLWGNSCCFARAHFFLGFLRGGNERGLLRLVVRFLIKQ
jgi:hypothetical protein